MSIMREKNIARAAPYFNVPLTTRLLQQLAVDFIARPKQNNLENSIVKNVLLQPFYEKLQNAFY